MGRKWSNVMRPARFQGAHKRRAYFEGYYLKIVDAERHIALALIPGVAYDVHGRGHAFIQVLDGVARTAAYHRFDVHQLSSGVAAQHVGETWRSSRLPIDPTSSFALDVAGNGFCESGCHLELPGLRLSVSFRQNLTWPHRWYSPGAMGPFSFAPAMQCRHGVVSLHHRVSGWIQQDDGAPLALSDGSIGYIEKDWGRSFPKGWIWLQTNYLAGESEPCCLMVSAGHVPWVAGAFEGFIAALLVRGRLIRFTTYNRASMTTNFQKGQPKLSFRRGGMLLEIVVQPAPGTALAAPVGTEGMLGRVTESLRSTATVRLFEHGRCILNTQASWVGYEQGGSYAAQGH